MCGVRGRTDREKQTEYKWQDTNLALFGSDIEKKIKEFSFHIKDELEHYPEIDQLNGIIDKSIADYKLAKKFN